MRAGRRRLNMPHLVSQSAQQSQRAWETDTKVDKAWMTSGLGALPRPNGGAARMTRPAGGQMQDRKSTNGFCPDE